MTEPVTPPPPIADDRLRLRLELERVRVELAAARAREADLQRREQALAAEQASMRNSRIAALNLIEDAVDARNRMARAQAGMQRERDLLQHVIESLPGVFYLFDAEGRFQRWNHEFEHVTGYSADEIAQMHPLDFFTAGEDRDRIAERIGEVFTLGRSDAEAGLRAKDGRVTPYYFTGQRVTIDGQPQLVGVGLDVSARRALEGQLREAQKMEAVGTLAGGIAHDFNNILGGMLGNLALLGDSLGGAHPGHAQLLLLHKAALRARRLVQQILAFSRREPTALRVQPLAPVVEDVVAMLRSMLPAAVTLAHHVPAQPLHARIDATQIEQVLLNLCTNAWHALPATGGRIEVTMEAVEWIGDAPAAAAPRQARITVVDNGCGMDEATRRRVFEPFFTTKPVGSGTGLGLSVAHGIVQAHGGSISVDSVPGKGSRFTIQLPAAEPERACAEAGDAQVPAPPPEGTRVLYIDDDPTMIIVVGQLLERAGLAVRCEADARRALDLLQVEPDAFDLVVTDYNMPELSGLDIAHAVHAQRPGLPVIISSGHIDDDLRAAAGSEHVHALLQKERTVEDMLPTLARVLAGLRPPL